MSMIAASFHISLGSNFPNRLDFMKSKFPEVAVSWLTVVGIEANFLFGFFDEYYFDVGFGNGIDGFPL